MYPERLRMEREVLGVAEFSAIRELANSALAKTVNTSRVFLVTFLVEIFECLAGQYKKSPHVSQA